MNKGELAKFARHADRVYKDDIIASLCSKKEVLDVGCIGQDRNYNTDKWLHNKIRAIAAKTDGVDILIEQIQELNKKGYSIFSVDELKGSGRRYDVVLMADVIEHVNDPVSFLTFYATFLKDDGLIFISTPNSNRANNFVNILLNNNYSVNPEHTFWFCPKTLSEVVARAELDIHTFYWVYQYYTLNDVKGIYQKFKFLVAKFLMSLRKNFNANMIFVLSKKAKA